MSAFRNQVGPELSSVAFHESHKCHVLLKCNLNATCAHNLCRQSTPSLLKSGVKKKINNLYEIAMRGGDMGRGLLVVVGGVKSDTQQVEGARKEARRTRFGSCPANCVKSSEMRISSRHPSREDINY